MTIAVAVAGLGGVAIGAAFGGAIGTYVVDELVWGAGWSKRMVGTVVVLVVLMLVVLALFGYTVYLLSGGK